MILVIDNRWLSTHGGGVDLDTSLLRAFVATAEETHFGRAADRLFITQQALSKRIARLEQILGAAVFDRTNRRVALTAAGTRLLPYAREAVEALDAAVAVAGVRDPVRVDVMDEHAAAVGLLRRAVERDPSLALQTAARGDRHTAIDALRAGDADIAFGRAWTQPWPADIRRRCALLEPVGLLVGEGHPWWSRSEVAMAELTGIVARFPMMGAPPDWLTFLDDLTAAFGIIVDRAGCSLGFDDFLDHPAEHPEEVTFYGLEMRPPADQRLRVIPLVEPSPVFAWAVMWRRRVPESVVDRLVAPAAARLPPDAWLPEADRAWIHP